jgi:hypothetical protein
MMDLRAPIGWASFVENVNGARTTRETRCRTVHLQRSLGWVLRASCGMTWGCAQGLPPCSAAYPSVENRAGS